MVTVFLFGNRKKGSLLASPTAPYSIHKCPEPQMCPKFVKTIVFRDSNQGDPKFVKSCRKLPKICPETAVFFFFSFFDQVLASFGPPAWNPEKQSSGQILDKFGVRGIFECCKGREGSQVITKKVLNF